jgi:hypothetical protein
MKPSRSLSTAALVLLASWSVPAGYAAAPPAALAVAQTDTVNAPNWQVGSSWDYSDGYRVRVSAVDGNVTVFERVDAPGQWFSMRGFLRQDATSGTAVRRTVYRTLTPEAGRALNSKAPLTFQREYLSNGELIVHASSWTVEGRERITVPAGTFDCWVIVWRARSLQSNWTAFERWWYSPDAQNYVRMEYKYGATATASRVLTRYSIAESPRSEPPALSSLTAPAPTAAIPAAPPPLPGAIAAAPVAESGPPPPAAAPEPRGVASVPIAQAAAPVPRVAVAPPAVAPIVKEDEERDAPGPEPAPSIPAVPVTGVPVAAGDPSPAHDMPGIPTAESLQSAALSSAFPMTGTMMSVAVASLADILGRSPGIVSSEDAVEQPALPATGPAHVLQPAEQVPTDVPTASFTEQRIAQAVLPEISVMREPAGAGAHPPSGLRPFAGSMPAHPAPSAFAKASADRRGEGKLSAEWVVQFGATLSEAGAHRHLAALDRQAAAAELPRGIERADLGERGTFYRAWVGSYDSEASASALCRELKLAGFTCFARARQVPAREIARASEMEWVVQIDSEKNLAGARRYAALAQKAHPTLLASLAGGIETVDFKEAGTFHRVWFGRFASEAEALSLCRALQSSGVTCYARLRPADVQTAARD